VSPLQHSSLLTVDVSSQPLHPETPAFHAPVQSGNGQLIRRWVMVKPGTRAKFGTRVPAPIGRCYAVSRWPEPFGVVRVLNVANSPPRDACAYCKTTFKFPIDSPSLIRV